MGSSDLGKPEHQTKKKRRWSQKDSTACRKKELNPNPERNSPKNPSKNQLLRNEGSRTVYTIHYLAAFGRIRT
jgi:hypothetical protein